MTTFSTRPPDEPPPGRIRRLMQFVRTNFIAGFLVAGPLFTTLWLLNIAYNYVDPPVQKAVLNLMGIDPTKDMDLGDPDATPPKEPQLINAEGVHHIRYLPFDMDWLPTWLNPNYVSTSESGQYQVIFGLGIFVILVLLLGIGFLARTFLGRWLFRTVDWVLGRVPLVKSIYSPLKQLTDTFFGHQDEKKLQKEVVLVEYPEPGSAAVGFVTGVAKGFVHTGALKLFNLHGHALPTPTPVPPPVNGDTAAPGEELVLVFIPMSPLPTGGFLLVVPRAKIVKLDITVEQAFQLIVSGGLVQPNGPVIDDSKLPTNGNGTSDTGTKA